MGDPAEITLECLRAAVNAMRYSGKRKVSEIVEEVIAEGFTREQALAALQRIANYHEERP